MSFPLRSSVWSASSAPGTAGSGICFTQTTTFMLLPVPCNFATRDSGNTPPETSKRGGGAEPGTFEPMEKVDVIVAGAGPAGTAAAISAVRRGLRVVCLDKAQFPRDKTCGDGLTTNALRLLEHLGLSRTAFEATGAATVAET